MTELPGEARTLPADSIERLRHYLTAIERAPKHLHLTSQGDLSHFAERHLLDAIHLVRKIDEKIDPDRPSLLDVGSGNGIPGLAIALMRPEWRITLLDSDNKKIGFLDTFCKSFDIRNVRCSAGRAESLARGFMRESFEIVTARALAKLPVALELTAPFAEVPGWVIVSHGTTLRRELRSAEKAIAAVGLDLDDVAHLDEASFAAFFRKVRSTPSSLPRGAGIPTKRPL